MANDFIPKKKNGFFVRTNKAVTPQDRMIRFLIESCLSEIERNRPKSIETYMRITMYNDRLTIA